MPITDYELVQQCLAGQDDAFAELVGRYKNLLGKVIYNLINNQDELSDLLQEVFIKIYKSLRQYNPEYPFAAWCKRIAANHCLDQLRKRKPSLVSLEESPEIYEQENHPEEEYLKREMQLKMRKTLNGLPEKYRVPIVLYHQNGLSYEEITSMLGLPMTVIKNRLYRGRLMLREVLLNSETEVFQ